MSGDRAQKNTWNHMISIKRRCLNIFQPDNILDFFVTEKLTEIACSHLKPVKNKDLNPQHPPPSSLKMAAYIWESGMFDLLGNGSVPLVLWGSAGRLPPSSRRWAGSRASLTAGGPPPGGRLKAT